MSNLRIAIFLLIAIYFYKKIKYYLYVFTYTGLNKLKKLIRLRKSLGLSQEESAQAIKISVATLCNIEKGRGMTVSSAAKIQKWAKKKGMELTLEDFAKNYK